MQYNFDDVKGYIVGHEHVCPECITGEELNDIEAKDILTEQNIEETYTFCDHCRKLLS